MVEFRVPSIPVAQPRQRHGFVRGQIRNWTPARHPVNAFKAAVQLAFSQAGGRMLMGPVVLQVTFRMPRPKAMLWKTKPMPEEYHTKKPDLDNLLKAVKDALTGLAWRDDAQVCFCYASKLVCAGNSSPGVLITIRRVEE